MPMWISSLLAPLGAVVMQMMLKTLGYAFISKAAVIAAHAWAKTTETQHDDAVVKAWAEALGVPVENLK